MKGKSSLGIICLFIFVAALSRILPHPPNFTAVGAMALFGAYYFKNKAWSFAIPILALWFSDIILNNIVYSQAGDTFTLFNAGMIWVYGAFIAMILFGIFFLKKVNLSRLLISGVSVGIIFFLISNFGVWATSSMYPKTGAGLIACYTAGLAFLRNSLIGNIFYVTLFFGAYEWMIHKKSILVSQEA